MSSKFSAKFREVSQGNCIIYGGLLMAYKQLGDSGIKFFLAHVKERGSELWNRFKEFQVDHPDASFQDFVATVCERGNKELIRLTR